jgi:GTPase
MARNDLFNTEDQKTHERAVLVGMILPGHDREEEEENLQELSLLVNTAGAKVVQAVIQERKAPNVSTYLGKGKVEELAEICQRREADLIVFDNDLSPIQARNLEKLTKTNVIDRTEVILDIFAGRARSRQSKLQVELAQLEYLRPRLRRMWEHLSRQTGGIGTRGPGETQLEVDRRRLGERVSHLKRELDKVEQISETKAQQRRREAYTVAMVGYTNVGKSMLMNALTQADVHVADALFATLDSTTRKLQLGEGKPVLLTDTVGFVRKLPHHLVESFKATLSEVRSANLVLHIADISSPTRDRQIEAVEEVLGTMDIDPDRTLRVFNKIDAMESTTMEGNIQLRWPDAILVSAITGEGLEELVHEIRTRRQRDYSETVLRLPPGKEAITSRIYDETEVIDVKYGADGSCYRILVAPTVLTRLISAGAKEELHRLKEWEEEPGGDGD